ncbi:hypothetical protein HYPSUDRAFT_366088 [Hypholoma sublateritium FD-334 SS-4]|uniref:Uncharacterized protein n=1 Tax=Hypholoma sublateritium (strain FD-334 SS-4) TaxID=945553 RepID=A0A0D2P4V5_HYPSF|nr:hypothetical protein HYPSUDRAFT_366088 [Hypholoma sublateritium FD-334 SS-4]
MRGAAFNEYASSRTIHPRRGVKIAERDPPPPTTRCVCMCSSHTAACPCLTVDKILRVRGQPARRRTSQANLISSCALMYSGIAFALHQYH